MNKLFYKICKFVFGKHSNNSLPRIWILAFDMVIVVIAFLIAMTAMYFNYIKDSSWPFDWGKIFIPVAVYLIMFLLFKTYEGMLRYSGFKDLQKIFYACTLAVLILFFSKFALVRNSYSTIATLYPRYHIIIYHYLITLVLLVISRFIVRRIYNEYFRNSGGSKKNILVYGAGETGQLFYDSIYKDKIPEYNIIAFIDDNPKKQNRSINGIRVMSPEKAFDENYLKANKIGAVILAIPNMEGAHKKSVIENALSKGLDVKTLSAISNWYNNGEDMGKVEDIKIEDLLGREPIQLNNDNIRRDIKDKVVMVTGAAGSIGSEICRQVLHYEPECVIMVDQAESPMYDFQYELNNTPVFKKNLSKMHFVIASVKDAVRMEDLFNDYHPQIIFHAAAYKHVPFMEENPYEAVAVNVFGTKNMADLAIKYGVEKFVMISTDKAVNPTNVMGATKRIAEIYTQSRKSDTKFITTRFGNVLGSSGSVVPLFKKQIEQGGPLTVTDKRITRYFMTIPEACSLVLEAGSIGDSHDIFVFDMGNPVKIWDLADKMRQLAHHPEIEIVEIGLRPGEKLYEEVLAKTEDTLLTDNPKIRHAKVHEYEETDVNHMLELLQKEEASSDSFRIVAQMKAIVPEFISNNSVFEKLDNSQE